MKKITSEEIKNALKEDNMYIVVDYITQQEKVNELLKLKNRKIKYLEARLKYNHGDKINFLMYFDKNLNTEALENIEIEIKELERELNEIIR